MPSIRTRPIAPVDAWIAAQPPETRATLEAMRKLVREVVPEAEESVSYGTPCFKHHTMLVGIGATKKGRCCFYTMSPTLVARLAPELANVEHAGSTLHFVPGKNLPVRLLKKIVKLRRDENEGRAAARKRK